MSEKEKTIVYKPNVCKGDNPLYTGQVIVRVPSYEERTELMLEADVIDNPEELKKDKRASLRAMAKLVKASYDYYKRVDITHVETSTKFKSVDDLRYSPLGSLILQEVATYLLRADGLGKN